MVEQGRVAELADDALDDFLQGYLECATWCGVIEGPDGESTDNEYGPDELTDEAIETARETCQDFIVANYHKLASLVESERATWGRHGHDFYLTRCGHGAGFWDRGYGAIGDELTEMSRPYGSATLGVELTADGDEMLVWLES